MAAQRASYLIHSAEHLSHMGDFAQQAHLLHTRNIFCAVHIKQKSIGTCCRGCTRCVAAQSGDDALIIAVLDASSTIDVHGRGAIGVPAGTLRGGCGAARRPACCIAIGHGPQPLLAGGRIGSPGSCGRRCSHCIPATESPCEIHNVTMRGTKHTLPEI